MDRKYKFNNMSRAYRLPEKSLWDSGFSVFKRRIGEQLQMNGIDVSLADDETLLPFYRMGESETYVLSAFGCAVGM